MNSISLIKRKNLVKENAIMDSLREAKRSEATPAKQLLSEQSGRCLPFNDTVLYSFMMFFLSARKPLYCEERISFSEWFFQLGRTQIKEVKI